jgi:hypothetical protein
MTSLSWLLRRLAVSLAVVTLVAIAAVVAFGLAYPEPVSSGTLGPDWQCTRLALVFTTCTRIAAAKATSLAEFKGPSCRRHPLALGFAMRVSQ